MIKPYKNILNYEWHSRELLPVIENTNIDGEEWLSVLLPSSEKGWIKVKNTENFSDNKVINKLLQMIFINQYPKILTNIE